jgi:hypothetical protein
MGLVTVQRRGGRLLAGVLRHARTRRRTTSRGVGGHAAVTGSSYPGIVPGRGRWMSAPEVGFLARVLSRVCCRLSLRSGPPVFRIMAIHFVRQHTRLVRLDVGSLTFRSARILATPRIDLGVVGGLVYDLRLGRGLLIGPGYQTPVYGLFGIRPFGVLSGRPGGTL